MKRTLLFVGGSIALIAAVSYLTRKKESVEHIIDSLQFKIKSIKNFKISLQQISLDLQIIAVNPTKENLHVNTGFIKANVLRVFEKKTGKLLAFSKLNTNTLNIPSGGFMELPDAHLDIPTLSGGQMLINHFLNTDQAVKDFSNQLAYELELEALGQTKIIKF
ncbi:hypothetical protein SAMN04489761_4671 [Tenacibaculum sp. MAR_2009_124]|uniref:hypothetical protein n=1 Tax=Tenacibaculum sp. MAR_2009_124 TaxID=1250059 RepID=UPI000895EDF9|nr:hypothetical protein [Tenacibaculum sp. MAR_2009_124]SED22113.1 hypothetical protein SAMN04489761_4671 [Tenacibaculum sp. MAR_2009_124]